MLVDSDDLLTKIRSFSHPKIETLDEYVTAFGFHPVSVNEVELNPPLEERTKPFHVLLPFTS